MRNIVITSENIKNKIYLIHFANKIKDKNTWTTFNLTTKN